MIRYRAVLAACAAALLLAWVVLPLRFRPVDPDAALITVRAADSGIALWGAGAVLLTLACMALVGWALHGLRAGRAQQVAALTRKNVHEGVAICSRRGQVRWVNEAGRGLLLEGGALHPQVMSVLARAVQTRKATLQGVALTERTRMTVQAIPERGQVLLIARPAQDESSQAQFYERFMRRIVHDMRNPLAAIIAHAENLRTTPAGSPAVDRKAAQIIADEAVRLTRLVDSLLFDARLTYVPLNTEALDLADLLQEAIYAFEERAAEEDKPIRLETPAAGVTAEVDHDLLLRAIGNLLDNSLKYSPSGAPIVVTLQADASQITMTVADHGDGIPPEYLPTRIFEPLVRARPRETGSGSGLGLSIVKKTMDLHGGRVRAESRLGEGTQITLWLPR
jgi:signal transduction histidine kinase